MRPALLPAAALLAVALGAGDAACAGPAGAADNDAPYTVSDANAGARPMAGDAVFRAFHGKDGIDRMVADLVSRYKADPRIKDIFAAADDRRLARMLSEQICYITGGPCHYTGRDMRAAHADMGVQTADFNALVEDLQAAMDAEKIPVWAQNKLLAKLAPMKRIVVTR
jgi:hemoglobin